MKKFAKLIGLMTLAVAVMGVSMASWAYLYNAEAPKELLK